MLSDLGTILSTINHLHLPPQHHLLLHRPVPVFEPANAPDCCFISRLWACDRYDYCRLQSSVVLGTVNPIGVRFVDRPVAWWIGKGKLAHKAVETIDIMVYGESNMELFVTLARVGFTYPGATKRRRKRK